MCAFVDAYAGKARTDQTLMVSLGTGVLTRALPYSEARHWGLAGWGRKILDVVFDGVSDTVDYQLAQILGDRYHRFQTKLESASDEMDDASDQNVQNLKLEGEALIENPHRRAERCLRQAGPPTELLGSQRFRVIVEHQVELISSACASCSRRSRFGRNSSTFRTNVSGAIGFDM